MRVLLSFIFVLLLASCGGGGSSDNTSSPPTSNPPGNGSPPPTTNPPTNGDTTPPDAPVQSVSDNSDGTVRVSGTAEPGSIVAINFPDGSRESTTTAQNGSFGPIDSLLPQINGIISSTSTDSAGNQSVATETNYSNTVPPFPPNLSLTTNDNNSLTISGSAEAASVITLTFFDGSIITTNAQDNGVINLITDEAPQVSGVVTATATDVAGNESSIASAIHRVTPVFASPLRDLVDDAQAREIVRFLSQSTFGASEVDIQSLVASDANYGAWIDLQMAFPATDLLAKADERMLDSGLSVTSRANLDQAYHKQLITNDMLWDTFANGEDQLRQRVAFALSQIFVVSETSDTLFNNARGVAAYHDILARHAFGNYRDLMQAVTLNPIMGEYLSMIRNEKANDEENIRPDENYARELLQLFSIGLVMLNQDGSSQLDEDGQSIATYDQDIVKEFARVFTGWTYGNAQRWNFNGWLVGNMTAPMRAFEAFHDTGEKVLLGGEILPAGQTALENLEGALDNIFNHQNVPPFVSKQLIQRLVTSNPSPDYVSRISAVFRDNGEGVRGDLGAVVRAILLDEEARTGHLEGVETFGKIKEPLLKFTGLMRAFDVTAMHPINEAGDLAPTLRYFWPGITSGQRPYGAPSVFNFFRPDFSPPGPIRDAGLKAPEAQILNEYFITEATNYGSSAIFNSYDFLLNSCNDRISLLDGFGCPYADFSDELALTQNTADLLDRLDLLMLAGKMTPIMREALTTLAAQQTEPRFVVAEVVHLIYISPQFALQH